MSVTIARHPSAFIMAPVPTPMEITTVCVGRCMMESMPQVSQVNIKCIITLLIRLLKLIFMTYSVFAAIQ